MPSQTPETGIASLTLGGVLLSRDETSSVAILFDGGSGEAVLLKMGERFRGLELEAVYADRVELRKGNRVYSLFLGRGQWEPKHRTAASSRLAGRPAAELNPSEPSPENDPERRDAVRREFDRSEVESRLEKEWSRIMQETRFVPNSVDGNIIGFKITRLPNRSILSDIGLRRNDIIKEINGVVLNDISHLFNLYQRFKNESRINVLLERNEKEFSYEYILK